MVGVRADILRRIVYGIRRTSAGMFELSNEGKLLRYGLVAHQADGQGVSVLGCTAVALELLAGRAEPSVVKRLS